MSAQGNRRRINVHEADGVREWWWMSVGKDVVANCRSVLRRCVLWSEKKSVAGCLLVSSSLVAIALSPEVGCHSNVICDMWCQVVCLWVVVVFLMF